jgi:drug/metabolite transporter (DMT)-like permease
MFAKSTAFLDLASIIVCTLAWGTTWFAITLQLGAVDPVVSIVYRFGVASVLLFLWSAFRREAIALRPAQHIAAAGVGFFTFAIDYTLIYWAEERVASAVVAVIFAMLAFINLIVFRFAFGDRPRNAAWAAAGLGAVGVGMLSWSEIAGASLSTRAIVGLAMALVAVLAAAIGNAFARRGEMAGAPVAASTGWAMLYGALMLALFALVTGRAWTLELSAPYLFSLLHLSLVGSVIAFLLYYGLARRRGYSTASYIAALTPPLAMLISSLFEQKSWGSLAFGGLGLVILGQWILLRTRRA